MLKDAINNFYTQAAKKFSKLGYLQTVKDGSKNINTEKIDAAKIKNIMNASFNYKRLVSVDELFKNEAGLIPTENESFTIKKLNDKKILTNPDYDTWICDFDEDTLKEFFGDNCKVPITFYAEEIEKIEAEKKAKREAAKAAAATGDKRLSKGGIFNYEYFYSSAGCYKQTLSKIIEKAGDKKLLWTVCSAREVSGKINVFNKLKEMFNQLGKEFNYELVATCQCVWDNNKKKFPDTENDLNKLYDETRSEFDDIMKNAVQYKDISGWILEDIAKKEKAHLEEMLAGLKNKKITSFIFKIVENYKFVKSLPFSVAYENQKNLLDEEEYKGMMKDYEMLRIDELFSDIRHERDCTLAKDIRYINMVDAYNTMVAKENA